MKKLFYFLIVIGLLWLASSWYLGRQVAPQMERYLQNLHAHFGKQSGLEYQTKIVKQGLFTSTVQVDLNASLPAYKKLLNALPPERRHITLQVEHGPLFFRHGLGMGLARITGTQRYATYQKFFDALKIKVHPTQSAVRTVATVSFARNVHVHAQSDALSLKGTIDTSLSTRIAPFAFEADLDPETLTGTYQIHLPSIQTHRPDAPTDHPLLSIQDLAIDGRIDTLLAPGLFLGRVELRAAHARLLLDPKRSAEVIDLAPRAVFAMRAEGNGTVGIDYDSGFRLLEGVLPGAATLITAGSETIHLGGLSQQGILAFSAQMRHFQNEQLRLYHVLLTDKNNPEKMAKTLVALQELQQQMQKKMILSLARILIPDQSTLEVSVHASTHSSPDNQIHARLRLIGTLPRNNVQAIQQKLMHHAPELFALDANASFGTNFLSAFGPQGIQLNAMLALALKQGFVMKGQGGRYTSSLHYTPQELIINHKPMPQLFMMLKMLGGGPHK